MSPTPQPRAKEDGRRATDAGSFSPRLIGATRPAGRLASSRSAFPSRPRHSRAPAPYSDPGRLVSMGTVRLSLAALPGGAFPLRQPLLHLPQVLTLRLLIHWRRTRALLLGKPQPLARQHVRPANTWGVWFRGAPGSAPAGRTSPGSVTGGRGGPPLGPVGKTPEQSASHPQKDSRQRPRSPGACASLSVRLDRPQTTHTGPGRPRAAVWGQHEGGGLTRCLQSHTHLALKLVAAEGKACFWV